MAQFRTTADIVNLILQKAGEVTNGNSPYLTQVINYLNRVHMAIVSGGSIPVGVDDTVEIDELWPWARSKTPMILELQPKINSGTVTVTQGSASVTFSSAPTVSVAGWYLQVSGKEEVLRIAQHSANSTSAQLDGPYSDDSGSVNFTLFKLDYDLTPSYLVIDSSNCYIDFQKVNGVTLTTTLTQGTYTPSALATLIGTAMTVTAAGPTITCSYDSLKKKFTIISDGAGSTILNLQFASGPNQLYSTHKLLGYDDVDQSAALTYSSTYILGGIARLVEPIRKSKGFSHEGNIYGIDPESFQREYPIADVKESYPNRFAVVKEKEDGSLTVRFNAYPVDKARIEVEYVPVPRDLQNSSGSIPLLPRKWVDILEDAGTFYVMLDKSDDRGQTYAQLLKGKLKAMVAQHRGSEVRMGPGFGEITPRIELTRKKKRFFRNGQPY